MAVGTLLTVLQGEDVLEQRPRTRWRERGALFRGKVFEANQKKHKTFPLDTNLFKLCCGGCLLKRSRSLHSFAVESAFCFDACRAFLQ